MSTFMKWSDRCLNRERMSSIEPFKYTRDASGERGAIPMLERGACNDQQILAAFETVHDTRMDGGEPRNTIGIRQRNSVTHLGDVLFGVQ